MSIIVLGIREVRDQRFHPPGSHRDWSVLFFHDATRIVLAGEEQTAAAGSLVFLEPGMIEDYGCDGVRIEHSWFRCFSTLLPRWLAESDIPCGRLLALGGDVQMEHWLRLLDGELAAQPERDLRVVTDLVQGFVRRVARILHAGRETQVPASMRRARLLIEERFRENLCLEGLAAAVGLSRSHFATRYRACFGIAPMQQVCALRMRRAADLLARSDDSVTAIATAAGYQDLFVFSKRFKQHYGCSPSAYRRRLGLIR